MFCSLPLLWPMPERNNFQPRKVLFWLASERFRSNGDWSHSPFWDLEGCRLLWKPECVVEAAYLVLRKQGKQQRGQALPPKPSIKPNNALKLPVHQQMNQPVRLESSGLKNRPLTHEDCYLLFCFFVVLLFSLGEKLYIQILTGRNYFQLHFQMGKPTEHIFRYFPR